MCANIKTVIILTTDPTGPITVLPLVGRPVGLHEAWWSDIRLYRPEGGYLLHYP